MSELLGSRSWPRLTRLPTQGKNRFHVNIGLFDVTADRLSGLLT